MQTEKILLIEIMQLLEDLEKATYGSYRADGHVIPPNASRFYSIVKRLYEQTDILVNTFSPGYISSSDYNFIYDSQRVILLHLEVLRNNKKVADQVLTRELENYLMELNGVFGCISTYCKKMGYISSKSIL